MTLKALSCPHCGAPVSLRAEFCSYCRAPIHVRELLEIDPSDEPRLLDFTTGACPEGLQGHAQPIIGTGLSVTLHAGSMLTVAEPLACRNAAVALTAAVYDPEGAIDVGLRMLSVGSLRLGYLLRVQPAYGRWEIFRVIGSTERPIEVEPLASAHGSARIAPIRAPIRVELRAADTLLQAFVDGRLIGKAEDHHLGFGEIQWGVSAGSQLARFTLVTVSYGRL